MAISDGLYQIGPAAGRLLITTGRTGLGARAGHDLTLEPTGWQGSVVVNTAEPKQSSVQVDVRADTIEVLEGTGGVKPLTDSDRADIKHNIRSKVLYTDQYPIITFRSTDIAGALDAFTIGGELTIRDTARHVVVQGSVADDGRVRAVAMVKQTEWGIKPYSAFLGALKLADDVKIEVDAVLSPDPAM
ncbi:YceI family protein [Phytoactinopolyspora mesophila]|uniref:YceI family protein n=1 Tax=Phytoactinopolyspora mesophila TaxID=2650750 RepID=A0A7K3LZY4_9ACTN|nr:YceI family protein [Phytoactinopolyspora mesophila]NDL56596.1 YceI family protein [Phytoactinopolyspora mesophila]